MFKVQYGFYRFVYLDLRFRNCNVVFSERFAVWEMVFFPLSSSVLRVDLHENKLSTVDFTVMIPIQQTPSVIALLAVVFMSAVVVRRVQFSISLLITMPKAGEGMWRKDKGRRLKGPHYRVLRIKNVSSQSNVNLLHLNLYYLNWWFPH